ncbi:MAG TPA: transcriptional regulator [Candidatus Cloacimonadota bacterium]|nr:transcriptional regulator [Candidatus Cloacimonadota bacterium]
MINEEDLKLDEIDRVIHEPARLSIMIHLSILLKADFTYLLCRTKLSRGNLSVQLQNLENAGYIEIQKEFVKRVPRTMVSLSEKGEEALKTYRKHLTEVLSL